MKTGLVQQQSTKLALTKELQQAITLLQYTSYELTQYINELSLENPFILLHDMVSRTKKNTNATSFTKNKPEFDPASPSLPTLFQHALSQIELQKINPTFKKKIQFLLENMDEDGYIREDIPDLCERTDYKDNELQEALEYIQHNLEPIGIGAQDLQQSLLIQLKRIYPTTIIAHKLVEHYFIPLAEKKWFSISKELEISLEEIQQSFDLLKKLNPRPGSPYKKGETSYIIPDLFVEMREDGFRVLLNEKTHTSFTIDEQYVSIKNQQLDQAASVYLKEKYQQARWVKNSVEQRKKTMIKVMEAILVRQDQFFEHGLSFLQPLTMREIADEVQLHESTISRTVRGKYVQSTGGVFELKYFFHSKVKSMYDKDISSVRVKEMISHMIAHEEKRKPLSDEKISARLKEEHKLTVSRRTVAKYRDQLLIPSSPSRKQF
ncbi:RNA polymerase factor sigma-54 [Bacillus sp. DJP31]|uniref:RNA polymerase factor sigma-54 n=1 Tax=Bacillus sp. DJP31 TaxID=3409789 RepID=UPI003BB51531